MRLTQRLVPFPWRISRVSMEDLSVLPACSEFLRRLPMAPVATNSSDCVICTQDFAVTPENAVCRLAECGHEFHVDCVRRWLERRSSCPICRCQLPSDNLAYLRSLGLYELADLREQVEIEYLNARSDLLLADSEDSGSSECGNCNTELQGIPHYHCEDCDSAFCTDCFELDLHREHTSDHTFAYSPGNHDLAYQQLLQDLTFFQNLS